MAAKSKAQPPLDATAIKTRAGASCCRARLDAAHAILIAMNPDLLRLSAVLGLLALLLALQWRFGYRRDMQLRAMLDNLLLAAPDQLGESVWAPIVRGAAVRRQEALYLQRAEEILDFTTLDKVSLQAARHLSGGQQKLLELARVLMGRPQMIMLDEPAAGVNPALTEVLMERIHALNAQGMSFLIIEHNMDLVMRHCKPIIAMANGRVIFKGTAAEALDCQALLDSYLGDMELIPG
jgi:branched-chain amino acid transport system ATP-binding protein